MKFSILINSAQTRSQIPTPLGTGGNASLLALARIMAELGVQGDIYDLPCNARNLAQASPFSIHSGFALNPLELDLSQIPEIQANAALQAHLTRLQDINEAQFNQQPQANYQLRALLWQWALEQAFAGFAPRGPRQQAYAEFQQATRTWLLDYVAYLQSKGTNAPQGYHEYVQFLCWEQKTALKQTLDALGVGLILNLPFGLELDSADCRSMPLVFDNQQQVGCSPEPYHGFPEQAWGIAPYRECSPALKNYLLERMGWLSRFGKGLFLDHLVGWCGQYVLPAQLPQGDGPQGHFLTEDPQARLANIGWFFEILKSTGMDYKGEIAGDHERVDATLEGLKAAQAEGLPLAKMVIPRWNRNAQGRMAALSDLAEGDLLMLETHDTSTLLQYLCNQKGIWPEFETPANLQEFCCQVLGWPLFLDQLPLKPNQISDEAAFEVFRRLWHGAKPKELVFTLGGLVSWLHPKYRDLTRKNNINLQPGTSGEVGNEMGNWSFFAPPVDALAELKPLFQRLGPRSLNPFYPAKRQELGLGRPWCLWSSLQGKSPLVLKDGRIEVPQGSANQWELLLANPTDQPQTGLVSLHFMGMPAAGRLRVEDALQPGPVWEHDLAEVQHKGLFYQLVGGQRNHLLLRLLAP